MVVVDQFSKMAHFIPTKESVTAQETGRLFFMQVFKHHNLFKDIMSDWNPKFTSKFWWALWKRMGLEFKMSTSFRPQTDGQTKRVNLVVQQFQKNYVVADQQNWVDHLELAKFCYNKIGAFGNRFHTFSNGEGQITNCAYNVGRTRATPKWCKWGSANGHTTRWREALLMGDGESQSWEDT